MKLYNTLTRKIEEFIPLNPPSVTFYTCGPTVYDFTHIGHMRTYTNNDVLKRVLTYLGYKVNHVMNVTDVGHLTGDDDSGEDKMEKGAKREGMTPEKIAKKYIDIFESDTKALNLLEPTFKPRATEYIAQMIDIISVLLGLFYLNSTEPTNALAQVSIWAFGIATALFGFIGISMLSDFLMLLRNINEDKGDK